MRYPSDWDLNDIGDFIAEHKGSIFGAGAGLVAGIIIVTSGGTAIPVLLAGGIVGGSMNLGLQIGANIDEHGLHPSEFDLDAGSFAVSVGEGALFTGLGSVFTRAGTAMGGGLRGFGVRYGADVLTGAGYDALVYGDPFSAALFNNATFGAGGEAFENILQQARYWTRGIDYSVRTGSYLNNLPARSPINLEVPDDAVIYRDLNPDGPPYQLYTYGTIDDDAKKVVLDIALMAQDADPIFKAEIFRHEQGHLALRRWTYQDYAYSPSYRIFEEVLVNIYSQLRVYGVFNPYLPKSVDHNFKKEIEKRPVVVKS